MYFLIILKQLISTLSLLLIYNLLNVIINHAIIGCIDEWRNMNSFSVPLIISENEITVDVFESTLLKLEQDEVAQNIMDKLPGVYCFFDKDSIYIGESVHPFRRLREHLRSQKLTANDNILVFRSEQFHKSAIYDIETHLIEYVGAEQKIKLRNIKENQGNHDYFLKFAYSEVITRI